MDTNKLKSAVTYQTDVNFEHCQFIGLNDGSFMQLLENYDTNELLIYIVDVIEKFSDVDWVDLKVINDYCDTAYTEENVQNDKYNFTADVISYYGIHEFNGMSEANYIIDIDEVEDLDEAIENIILEILC